ncbi:MAG TPA: phosphoesterase [Planctomycetaceae bacterium]|nr:phosphoesterase [Planctomycetaceae bacterium]
MSKPAMAAVEHVLVVPTALFHEVGHFQGFCREPGRYLETLLDPAHTSYRPRDQVEEDPAFKQLIPYCVFRCAGQVFHYKRGKLQGERRLHSKRSIGIGGHISALDHSEAGSPYLDGLRRELEEEVVLDTAYRERCVGLINDDDTEVGRVHLGIVHVFDLDQPKVRPREESIIETGFADPADLKGDRDQFETWSQICLDYLFA